MEPIYSRNFEIGDNFVDRYCRLRPSMILYMAQEMGGQHAALMSLDYDTLANRRMFWAITRHRVQITRLPHLGETLRVETWPLPATRTAFPRSVVAYDMNGNECFRAMTLWVLLDLDTRAMILPGKSGIIVNGTVRGTELALPGGLMPKPTDNSRERTVCFTDLDRNGHMNNTRYLDWVDDLFPSPFHRERNLREFTVCYHNEAREGQILSMGTSFLEDNSVQVEAHRAEGESTVRVFSCRMLFD